jgi:Uncharacterised nucleotidyltransferase
MNICDKKFILSCLKELIIPGSSCLDEPGVLSGLDWDWIVKTSTTHGILGFIASVLERRNLLMRLDPMTQATLKGHLMKCLFKNQLKRQQFQRLSAMLRQRDIDIILLKGIALTHLVYDEMPCRQMWDIDILVRECDLKRTFEVLSTSGFRHPEKLSARNRWHAKIFAETSYLLRDVRIGRIPLVLEKLEVDIHYNPRYMVEDDYSGMDIEGVWGRAVPFPHLGPNVYMLNPKDQLLHLLLHSAEGFKTLLIQVLDIGLFSHKYGFRQEDIADKIIGDLPLSSRARVYTFIRAMQELLDTRVRMPELSPETIEVFERFFSFSNVHHQEQEAMNVLQSPMGGLQILSKIDSPWKRASFLAGYLLPDPDYYKGSSTPLSYLTHWRDLLLKGWRLLSGKR